MQVTKRDNTKQNYDIKKVKSAIYKAFQEKYGEVDKHLERDIDDIVLRVYDKRYDDINVETIQDMVESEIMSSEYFDVAKIYILYRKEKTDERTKEWEMNELQKDIYNSKYRHDKETFDDFINRVSGGNSEVAKAIRKKEFMPAGRVLAGRGLSDKGVKISLTNCFFIKAPEDNIPSIMQTASDMAVTYSRGGGCGTDISKLRPRDAKVNNAARSSTGAVSFMELYSLVTGLISMKGRRGALMLSMSIDHPDIMEFIDIKTDLDSVTNANISVKITDEFMKKVENNEEHVMEFFVESTGETIRRTVKAKDLLYKLAENNHRSGEPGMLFWDNITSWSIMSEDDDYEYAGVNPL